MLRYILIIGFFFLIQISSNYICTVTYILNNVSKLEFFSRDFSQLKQGLNFEYVSIFIQKFLLCIKCTPCIFYSVLKKSSMYQGMATPRCVWFCQVFFWRLFDDLIVHSTWSNGWHAFWLGRNYNVTLGSAFFPFHFNFSVHSLWSWLIDISYAIMFWIQAYLHSKGIFRK